jgi:hypothetical protein
LGFKTGAVFSSLHFFLLPLIWRKKSRLASGLVYREHYNPLRRDNALIFSAKKRFYDLCLLLAFFTLNLVEVSPETMHLPFTVWAASVWLARYPDDTAFWVDYGIGRRVCVWLETVLSNDSAAFEENQAVKCGIGQLLAGLVLQL